MKRLWNCLLLVSLLVSSGSLAAPIAAAQEPSDPMSASSAIFLEEPPPPPQGGMPGWPVPDKPIPYHEVGRPVRGTSYSTHSLRQNELGLDEVVQLTGLDALLADSVMNDPFQGNYSLVGEDQILAGLLNTSTNTLETQTIDIEGGALNPLDGTQASIVPVMQTDVTAGDLNGDGVDEQITAWLEDTNGYLNLSIGEMPVSSDIPDVIPSGVTARPGAVAYDDGNMDLVVRGYDGALWHKHYDGSSWGDWNNDAGGVLLSGPAIASRGPGQFDVFALGFDSVDPSRAVVYSRHYESDAWIGSWTKVDASDPGLFVEQALPLPEMPAPSAVSRGSGNVDVFWLKGDNTLHRCVFDGSVCGSGEDLGGMLTSGPGVVSLNSNHMQVFARGVDESLWYRTYDSGWGSWELLEMPPDIAASSAPTVVTPASGLITVFVQGKDTASEVALDALYVTEDGGTTWDVIWDNDGSEPSERLDGGIGAVVISGVIKIFAQMENGSLGVAQFSGSLSAWTIESLPASTEFNVLLNNKSIAGVSGRALTFDGLDDYVGVEADVSETAFAMSMWFKTSCANCGLFSADAGELGSLGHDRHVYLSGGNICARLFSDETICTSGLNLADDVWHHVIYMFGSPDPQQLWVDGIWKVSGIKQASDFTDQTGVNIGFSNDAAQGFLDGQIDEVVAFNRVLSPVEISTLFASGWESLSGKVIGLHLEEYPLTYGGILYDVSGLDNNGTFYPLTDADLRSPLKVEAGHYWGAGRELYAVAYVTTDRRIRVSLFDIGGEGGGFSPNLLGSILLDVEYNQADGHDDMDLAAGDVDGDGTDEIVVASIEPTRTFDSDLWLNVVKVQDCSFDSCTLADQNQPGGDSPPWSQSGEWFKYSSTIHIATGDLDGDGADEVAVESTTNYMPPSDYWRPVLKVVDDGVVEGKIYPDLCDFDDGSAWQPGPCTSGDMAIGNFIEEEGPVKDEIAFFGPVIWNCLGSSSNQCDRWYRATLYQFEGGVLTPGPYYDVPGIEWITGTGLYPTPVDQASIVLSDLDADFLDEMVLARCYDGTCTSYLFEPITLVDPPPSNPLVPGDTSELNSVGNPYDRVYLTAGDSLGESVRVGPPSYRHQQDTAQVIAIVNAPPKHKDVIDGIPYNLNADDEDTYSQFDQVEGTSTEVSVSTHKDWGVDSNFEATIGDPDATHVTTSIENSYGENFDQTGGSTKSLTFTQSIKAVTDDVLFYTRLDYDVWEYPVYNSMTFSPQGLLSVVWPASDFQSVVGQANSCNSWYRPNHQLMNVWSYPASEAQLLDRTNGDNDIYTGFSMYTLGDSIVNFSVDFSSEQVVSQSHGNEMGFASSFESQIGGEEIGVNLGVVEFSTRLPSIFFSTRGEYNSSELSQWTTKTEDSTRLSGYLDRLDDWVDYQYSVKPYMYWSESDYLVLDYVTDPSNQAFWSPLTEGAHYNRPDPAFIYPWADGQCDHLWPDAHFLTGDIGIDPPVAEVGDTVTITATLRNFSDVGNDSSPFYQSFIVSFYHGDPDAGGELIYEQEVAEGALGPREVLALDFEWIASGAGEQHMYVVIDSEDSLTEVHDENDPDINNNKGYAVLTMDEIEFVDMGLATEKAYHAINYRMGDPSPLSTLYTPLGALTQNLRIEIRYAEGFESLNILGSPFKIVPYQTDWENPESSFSFRSEVGDPPGVIMIDYAGSDLSGLEGDLTLWRFNGSDWEDATCASYQTYRFPVEDVLFVPLCDLTYSSSVAGTFALGGDTAPVPIALVADFSADPLSGAAPLEVQFQDESLGNPTSWEWDFGDESELCYDQNPLYEFTSPGTYTVTLTVSNVFDDTDVEEKLAYITVLEEQKLYLPLIMR